MSRRPLPMLPGDRRIAQLYKTFTHWLANTGRPCLPQAPQMRAEYVKEGESGIVCQILCIPPSIPHDVYSSVIKGFHPNCRVRTETYDDGQTPDSIQVIVPYEALGAIPLEDEPRQMSGDNGGGGGCSSLVGRMLGNTRFVIGLTIIVGLSASYTTDLSSWKALVEVFQ